MTAYLLAITKAENRAWLPAYEANVPAIMQRHGGEYVAVSEGLKLYEGVDLDPDVVAVFKFPSMDAIDAFISDADYAPYRAARIKVAKSHIVGFTPRY